MIEDLKLEMSGLREELSIAQAKHHEYIADQAKEREMVKTAASSSSGGDSNKSESPASQSLSPKSNLRRVSSTQRRKNSALRKMSRLAGGGADSRRSTVCGSVLQTTVEEDGSSSGGSMPRNLKTPRTSISPRNSVSPRNSPRNSLQLAVGIMQRRILLAAATSGTPRASISNNSDARTNFSNLTIRIPQVQIPENAVVLSPLSKLPPNAKVRSE